MNNQQDQDSAIEVRGDLVQTDRTGPSRPQPGETSQTHRTSVPSQVSEVVEAVDYRVIEDGYAEEPEMFHVKHSGIPEHVASAHQKYEEAVTSLNAIIYGPESESPGMVQRIRRLFGKG